MSEFRPTRCALCGTHRNSTELYPARVDPSALTATAFSARRLPDRLHFRMVRCNSCGLVRSDPVADTAVIENLYRQSTFTYADELENLKRTYGRYLDMLIPTGHPREALLEVGCGNGFFLEEALARGWEDVRGVEPGLDPVQKAPPEIQPKIFRNFMRSGLFPAGSFDTVCMFHVFDHLPEPMDFLGACLEVLRPGGFLLAINHNVEAFSARLLKERSPIVDLEHTYLWSPRTMARAFESSGFQVIRTGPVYNTYSARYVARLLPLGAPAREALLKILSALHLGRSRLRLPLGNLYLLARKPRYAIQPGPAR